MPLRQGHKAFALTRRLGTPVRLPERGLVAVRIAPTAYLPPACPPCPALTVDALCAIHADKRPGWGCDTSAAAPTVCAAMKRGRPLQHGEPESADRPQGTEGENIDVDGA